MPGTTELSPSKWEITDEEEDFPAKGKRMSEWEKVSWEFNSYFGKGQ